MGVIAIGHSGLTGEGTGGLSEPVPENSWATGTNPEVNSVYMRLAEVRPENSGHVANTATGGARSNTLAPQAQRALKTVPLPSLVIISTIDADIRCDGTDDDHIPEFGQAVTDVLELITTASPESIILIVGQLGRPSVDFVEQLVAHDPSVTASLSGSGPCDFLDAHGNIVPENFATLTDIIDRYEAEETRVCASVQHCYTDGGVRAAYVDSLDNFSSDWNHLNVRGQAAEAELIWPVVESVLGI
ncbi:hypothetical protein J7E29_18005 [Streptomyces sp. ISL-90]|nr:hypothetical protein [Streptomyces sp. ISL-90]